MSNLVRKQGTGSTAGKPASPEIVPTDQRPSPAAEPPDYLTDDAKEFWSKTLPQLASVMKDQRVGDWDGGLGDWDDWGTGGDWGTGTA
jgi:phage terminase small subunit